MHLNDLRYNLPDEEVQLVIPRSPSRPHFVNRILSKQGRRVQYRILQHLDNSRNRESAALREANHAVAE